MREVEMAQSMAADLEIGVGNQLLGALFVGLHPFAAGEERGLHALGAEKVDDPPVIAGDVAVGLAEIEGECDELLPVGSSTPLIEPRSSRGTGVAGESDSCLSAGVSRWKWGRSEERRGGK